jgi:hypothetical protein
MFASLETYLSVAESVIVCGDVNVPQRLAEMPCVIHKSGDLLNECRKFIACGDVNFPQRWAEMPCAIRKSGDLLDECRKFIACGDSNVKLLEIRLSRVGGFIPTRG